MFEYIGGVPTEIWFDNTKTIVTEIIKGGGREVTERFRRFSEHYRFKPVFMNPESGWEKGNVENKVGYLRRNELVPVPKFEQLSVKNKELLIACDKDMEREHYDDEDDSFISELFLKDNFAERAMTQKGETNQEYLYNLLKNEVTYRTERRKTKLLNTAGFPKMYTKEQFRTDEIDFPSGVSLASLLDLEFYRKGENLIFYGSNDLQNRFAITYIFILQLSAKRGCKKQSFPQTD